MAKATSNTYVDLVKESNQINDGNDSIVVINALGDIPGGRTLDLTGFSNGIKAGHIIYVTSTGIYKPMPISGTDYDNLPASGAYVGVARYSVSPSDPRCAIVTVGQINEAASPYAVSATIKAAMPRIEWLYGDA